MTEVSNFNEIIGAFVAITAILSATTGIYKWKADQIKKDTARHVTTVNNTDENHKDINQLKEIIISLQSKISELCDRISRMEGAFNQHNRERDEH